MRVTITIPGEAMPQRGGRIGRGGMRKNTEVAKKQREIRDIAWIAMRDAGFTEPFVGAVSLTMTVYRAKGLKGRGKATTAAMLSGEIRPTVTPDLDNLAKLACDALNGVVYHDDKQIVELHALKWYGLVPRTEIAVRSIQG